MELFFLWFVGMLFMSLVLAIIGQIIGFREGPRDPEEQPAPKERGGCVMMVFAALLILILFFF